MVYGEMWVYALVQNKYISANAEPDAADLHSGVQVYLGLDGRVKGLASVPSRIRGTSRMQCSKNAASMDSSSSESISNTSGAAAARKRGMWCMVMYVDVRWCMVVYGGVWWCMVVYGGIR